MGGVSDQPQIAIKQWTALLTTAFRQRIRADQLTEAFREQWSNASVQGTSLVSTIFTSGARVHSGVDPLIPAYLDEILKVTRLDLCDVLVALLSHSRYAIQEVSDQARPVTIQHDLPLLESVFALLLRLVINNERPKTPRECRRAVRALAEWMTACNYHEAMLQVQAETLQAPEASVISALESLGTFAISLLSNDMTRKDIEKSWPQDLKDKLTFALNNFATLLTQWTSSQVATRLQMIARAPLLTSGKPDFSMAEIASAVVDLPVSTSRTGLYVYLNAALCGRPLTDDLTLLNYLHSKYQSDAQSLTVDLILASFDTLANALHSHESAHSLLCYRSFIANKLPVLLVSLSTSLFAPLTMQLCIQTALGRIEVHPIPPLSSEDNGMNETLKSSRQEFLQACVLHQLGTESALFSIVGENSAPNPSRANRYTKESLYSQCVSSVHRVDPLVRELDAMNGNAGAISGALLETLQHFCATAETMSLRTLCNAMSRRLPLLDILFQYAQPTDLLLPLCKTLNEWTHDEDQSEFQPPYEEFASILLLVLAVIHRYQLSESDIGLTRDSFVIDLLARLSDSIPTRELTAEQSKHLSKWMQGLYATDEHGETNGISDETMSHCPPQEFYLLVPTLLEQSIYGCRANALALDTLKGGLEFLLEPFLLPSLVGGLSWLTKHSWEDHGDADILVQILHKLLRPTSISGDAEAMHQTIIAMISAPLERSLRELNRRVPHRKETLSLLDLLKPHLNGQRTSESTIAEIHLWISTPNGGLRRAIKDIVDGLVVWSSQSAINPIPTKYSHRMIIFALETLGADEVLDAVVDQIRAQTQVGLGSAALEVGTALVCTPSSVPSNPLLGFDGNPPQLSNYRRTLRQALRHKLESPKDMLSMETEYVEALIRLGRRVDAQSAVASIDSISLPISNMNADQIMQDIDMSGAGMTENDMNMQQSGITDDTEHQFPDLSGSLDLSAPDPTGLDSVSDPSAMQVDLSGPLFDPGQDLNFGIGGSSSTSQSQSQDPTASFAAQHGGGGGNGGGGNAIAAAQQQQQQQQQQSNNEDDIFAGLDMGDMGDDDFNFS